MKQLKSLRIAAVCCAALCAAVSGGTGAMAADTVKTQTVHITGDLNNNLKAEADDATDALTLFAYSCAGLESNETTDRYRNADVDQDGIISAYDASVILTYYVQKVSGHDPLWADVRDPLSVTDTAAERIDERRPVYLEIGSVTGRAGEEVTVPVYIAGADKLCGFQLYQLIPDGMGISDIHSLIGNQAEWNPQAEIYDLVVPDNETQEPELVSRATCGALVWVNDGGENLDISDGQKIAEFTYKIPENAASGQNYVLTCDEEMTKFVCGAGNSIESYACTMISGVITVA